MPKKHCVSNTFKALHYSEYTVNISLNCIQLKHLLCYNNFNRATVNSKEYIYAKHKQRNVNFL